MNVITWKLNVQGKDVSVQYWPAQPGGGGSRPERWGLLVGAGGATVTISAEAAALIIQHAPSSVE